jgi:hypothetical protein
MLMATARRRGERVLEIAKMPSRYMAVVKATFHYLVLTRIDLQK